MSGRPVVHLLDAHFQIFRAYHALPDLRAPDGAPIGAVRGYAQTLIKFLRSHEPTHVAAAFDFALTSFRNRLFADYKLGRTEAPEDLEPQFDTCAEVTRALGIELFAVEDFEADDVIATLVRRLVAQGADVAIVTRDKDLGALVSGRVYLLDLARDERSGPAEIEARLGVRPDQVGDYLALVGPRAAPPLREHRRDPARVGRLVGGEHPRGAPRVRLPPRRAGAARALAEARETGG
jgi:DNA polymerase-1